MQVIAVCNEIIDIYEACVTNVISKTCHTSQLTAVAVKAKGPSR